MKRQLAKKAVAAAILAFCGASGSARAADAPVTYTVNQTVEIKEAGRPARRCTIVSVAQQADGSMAYTVKASDDGETMTVYHRPTATPAAKAPKPASPYGVAVKAPAPAGDMPAMKDRTADPLLQLPAQARTDTIVANVNETAKSPAPKATPIAVTETPRESHGLFGWLFGPKAQAKPATTTVSMSTAPTVPSAMTSKPVPVETTGPVLAETAPVKKGVPATTVSLTKLADNSAAGFAVIGSPMLQPVPLSATSVPVVPVASPAMVPAVGIAQPAPPTDVRLHMILKEALQPSEREMAAMQMSSGAGASSPAVKGSLLIAAKEDPAATVRAGCLRCLAKIAPGDPATLRALEAAKEDKDVRVRNEANELLGKK